jgi:hypothetical protein
MPAHEIAAIRKLTHLDNDGDAILLAAREFLRQTRLRELKAASGKVEFDANWRELENLELDESMLPQ